MAAIDFPSSPITNQIYSINNKTWKWNGTSWTSLNPSTNQVFTAGTINAGSTASTTTTIIAPSTIVQNTLNNNPVIQGYSYQYTAGSFSFVLPSSANAMRVLISGGGGSGGGNSGGGVNGGGGGGAGSVMFTLYNVTPGTSFSATIGAGGAAVGANTDGLTGTASTFSGANISITCSPGAGGLGTASTGGAGGAVSATGLVRGTYLATAGSAGTNGGSCGCTPTGGGGGGAGVVADRVWPMGPSSGWVAPFNTYIRTASPIINAGNGGSGNVGTGSAGSTGAIIIYYFNSNYISP